MAKSDYGRSPYSASTDEHGRQQHERIFGIPKSSMKIGQMYYVTVRNGFDFDGVLTKIEDGVIFTFDNSLIPCDGCPPIVLDIRKTDFIVR